VLLTVVRSLDALNTSRSVSMSPATSDGSVWSCKVELPAGRWQVDVLLQKRASYFCRQALHGVYYAPVQGSGAVLRVSSSGSPRAASAPALLSSSSSTPSTSPSATLSSVHKVYPSLPSRTSSRDLKSAASPSTSISSTLSWLSRLFVGMLAFLFMENYRREQQRQQEHSLKQFYDSLHFSPELFAYLALLAVGLDTCLWLLWQVVTTYSYGLRV
jgi:hypothetical protein